MSPQNMPPAQLDVSETLVRSLLVAQHPDLADRALSLIAHGWDNVIFRLGDDLVVRLPRRSMAADLVLNEQRHLPMLARRLPIVIPAPLRLGVPSVGYPWHWSVGPWFDGDVAADVRLTAPAIEAERLGSFLAALHRAAPSDAPHNPYRARPVSGLRERFVARVEHLGDHHDRGALSALFDELLDVAEWSGSPVWVHGDLHTANVLVADGSISAIIDWGDITAGDPACDLAVGWMLFDDDHRAVFRVAAGTHLPIDDATWQRARAWALYLAVMFLAHSADSERFARMGTSLLARLLSG